MKTLFAALLLSFVSTITFLHAQSTVQDTIGGTPFSITMDPNVSGVMKNMEESCRISRVNSENRNRDDDDYRPSTAFTPSTPKSTVKVVANRALTNAEICRQNPRIMGVRIQLTIVKSNEEANQVKAYFRNRFPRLKADTDASLRPNYKILAGSYFNRQSASSDLAQIRKYFKSAIAVPYQIFCVEAK